MLVTFIPANVAFASTTEHGTPIADRSNVDVDIRFALFGDTHVTVQPVWTTAEAALSEAMAAYKIIDADMDAFAMPGDVIFNVDPASELAKDDEVKYKAVLDEINKTFPTASTQSNIVWAMGNHEITQGAYANSVTVFDNGNTWQDEVADNLARYENALDRSPIDSYTVNGYTFVTAAPYDYLNNYVNPADTSVMSDNEIAIKALLEDALEADSTKPVFYLQHEGIDATTIASNSTIPTRNSEAFRNFVLSNPRIVTLTGHYHYAANDPRTILQMDNGSTHITVPATKGSSAAYSCTKDSVTDNASATQAMLVEVNGAEVTVRRFDYVDKKYIGEPYVFTAGAPAVAAYTKAGREAAKTSEVNKPYFDADDKITVSDIKSNTVKISFPEGKKDGESADGLQDSYIHYYRVKVTDKETGSVVKSYNMLGNYFINSVDTVNYADPKYPAIRKTLDRELSITGLSRNTEYTVTVTPESALGQQGTALTADFVTSADKTDFDLALTTKVENKNVALGKKATAELQNGSTVEWSRVTDGDETTRDEETIVDNGSITLDLGRRYNIKQIILDVPLDSQAKQLFKLQVSNDAEFADSTTKTIYEVGGLADVDNAPGYENGTALNINLGGNAGYRYVRYLNTSYTETGKYMHINELKVIADEYATDVSKYAKATASQYYTGHDASKVLDGVVSEESSWWSDWNGAYNWLQIDLQKSLPVSAIQVDAGPDDDAPNFDPTNARFMWYVYGSNTVASDADKLDADKITADGYTQLAYATYLPAYKENGTVYSLNGDYPVDIEGIAKSDFDGTQYRYITLKHANPNMAAIADVKIWATNPVLNGVEKTDAGLKLSFSDPMLASTINANTVKLYDGNGVLIENAEYSLSEDGYDVFVTGANDAIKVELTYAVEAQNGMDLAGELVSYFESNTDFTGKPIVTQKGVNVSKGKKVTTLNTQLTDGSTTWDVIVDGDESTGVYTYTNIDASGNTVDVPSHITVDLGARYDIKKIEFKVRPQSQAKQLFDIQLSNDVSFNDFETVYSVAGLADVDASEDFVDNKLTLNLENKGYRYVRINRKQYAYMTIDELSVYADINMMEVTSGIKATASNTFQGYDTLYLTDGVNSEESKGWASGWNDAYEWVNLDLGAAVPLARIELESPYNGAADGDYNARRFWNIYGSNVAPNATDLNTTTQSGDNHLISAEGYTLLDTTDYGCMPSYNYGNFDEQVYYSSEETRQNWNSGNYGTGQNGILAVNVSGEYRYLTLQRGYAGYAALGEIRAYIAAPKANSVSVKDDKVYVNFSDKMFPHYLTSDYIKLYDAEGTELTYTNGKAVDAYTFAFTADLEMGTSYKVVVNKGVKNVNSIPLSIDNEIVFKTPEPKMECTYTLNVVEGVVDFDVVVTSTYPTDIPVHAYIAQYGEDGLKAMKLAKFTAVAKDTSYAPVEGISHAEGDTYKVYVWRANNLKPICVNFK